MKEIDLEAIRKLPFDEVSINCGYVSVARSSKLIDVQGKQSWIWSKDEFVVIDVYGHVVFEGDPESVVKYVNNYKRDSYDVSFYPTYGLFGKME